MRDFAECCNRPEPRAEIQRRVREAPRERKLDLLGMALNGLPATIGRQLPALTTLLVNTNSIKELPESVGTLRSLVRLNARFNMLRTLPASIGGLAQLVSLDVSNNCLADLPGAIGNLPLLQTLDINTNELATLPDTLSHARGLTCLLAHHNRLSALPEPLGQLPCLTCLDVSANALEALPDSIGHLKALKELDVRANRLAHLPDALGQLSTLQKLHAAANKLVALPSMAAMLSLRVLDLSDNQLAELPPLTADAPPPLRELGWKGNPLQRPPFSVASQGLEAIRRYFEELERAGATTSWAARLVLLGDGMAGKTSLQRGLSSGSPQPTHVDARTIQLDITTLTLLARPPSRDNGVPAGNASAAANGSTGSCSREVSFELASSREPLSSPSCGLSWPLLAMRPLFQALPLRISAGSPSPSQPTRPSLSIHTGEPLRLGSRRAGGLRRRPAAVHRAGLPLHPRRGRAPRIRRQLL